MPAPSPFTNARDANGRIRRVPRAWLEEGSPFHGQYHQTPSAKQEEGRSDSPDDSWTIRQLRQHAESRGIPVPASATKADVVSAITNHSASGAPDSQEG